MAKQVDTKRMLSSGFPDSAMWRDYVRGFAREMGQLKWGCTSKAKGKARRRRVGGSHG